MKFLNNVKGSAILALAALIWGLAFVAQAQAADLVPPFAFNSIRCFIGAAALFAALAIKSAKTKKPINNEKDDSEYVYLCEKEAIYAGMLSDILEQNSIPFTTNNVLGAGITSKIGYAAEIVRFFVHKDYFEIAKELEESYLSEKENV